MGPEELTLHQQVAVAEELLAALLVQLLQQAALVSHCDVCGVEPPLRLPAGDNMRALWVCMRKTLFCNKLTDHKGLVETKNDSITSSIYDPG